MLVRLVASKWAQDKGLSPKVIEDDLSLNKIEELNKQGYNVYNYPNRPKDVSETLKICKSEGRRINGGDITLFRYVYVDMDLKDGVYESKDKFLEVLNSFTLTPTSIVDSGHGIHAYWKIRGLEPMSFLLLQMRLARLFKTDDNLVQLKATLRLPNTLNVKDENEFLICKVIQSTSKFYTAEELDKNLPKITLEDNQTCKDRYDVVYNSEEFNIKVKGSINEEVPKKFHKLVQENDRIRTLFFGPVSDRSRADFELGHLLYNNGFSEEEATSVLCNVEKAKERTPKHRLSYAHNIIKKIWAAVKSSDEEIKNPTAKSVKEILGLLPDKAQENQRLYGHKMFDATAHGFRLTEVWGIIGGSGVGKCLGKDTPVLMYDGSIKKVQDIKSGELVMGPDSTPRKVVTTTTGTEEMFRIKSVEGDFFECNKSHILSLKYINSESRYGLQKNDIINVEVGDYLKWSKRKKSVFKSYRVSVEFNEKPLELDPYLLGVWLGDGHSNSTTFTVSKDECYFYLLNQAKKFNLRVRYDKDEEKFCTIHLTSTRNRGITNKLLEHLKKYDVIKNKHIPVDYKINSENNRLKLLAGLLDTDGYLINNCYEFVTKFKSIANDVEFISRSCGLYAKVREKIVNGVTYYRLFISGDIGKIPCKVKRKQAKVRNQIKNVLNYGFEVESLGIGTYYGFTLEKDSDRLFVLGDFTVTHNTSVSLNQFKWFAQYNPEFIHVFVSLEMPANEVAQRWIKMCKGDSSLFDKVYIIDNYDSDGNFKHLSLGDIKSEILALENTVNKKVGCVVVDHIGVLKSTPKNNGEYGGIQSVCEEMKPFAKTTNTFLIMQSQTSRAKAGIGDIELDKDAAYGTSLFENYCDYVTTIWQPLKRVYDEMPLNRKLTIIAFKFCKIRHKDVIRDKTQEDKVFAVYFDSESETIRKLTSDEFEVYDFWNKQATTIRNKDRKTQPAQIKEMTWVEDNV